MKIKRCNKCGEKKPLSEFYKSKYSKDGFAYTCKKCEKFLNQEFYKTKRGVAFLAYHHQVSTSKKKGYNLPEYTKEELYDWLLKQPTFDEFYDEWVKSGYDRWKKPSVDRIDDYKSYTFDNIQLMTWRGNNNKAHKNRVAGVNNKYNKSVLQYDLNGNFVAEHYSISQASRITGIDISSISMASRGIRKTAGNYKWKLKIALEQTK